MLVPIRLFACPFDDKHQITDYEIRFEQPENLRRHEITSEAFYTGKTTEHNLAAFNLDEHTFDDDALVFSGYNGDSVSLVERDSGRAIQVSRWLSLVRNLVKLRCKLCLSGAVVWTQ